MYSIYLIFETYTNGFTVEFLDILSLISIIFGIFIIISKNPIVSVLFLIFLFSSVSVYLIMIGINFIGISYLLVYVGAVSILFLFILMLINIRISELISATGNSMPLAIFISISFYSPLYQIIAYNTIKNNVDTYEFDLFNNNYFYIITNLYKYRDKFFFATSKSWDGTLAETTDITSLGNIMYSSYAIWLLLTSIILLLAMVGAIVITIKQ
jgi:NADH-ubiquinone oxidoreductase chain 6